MVTVSDETKIANLLEIFSNQILSINPEDKLYNEVSGILMALSYVVEQNKINEFLDLIKPFIEKEAKTCG
jgi:DNA-directed RNA polymerase subunit F